MDIRATPTNRAILATRRSTSTRTVRTLCTCTRRLTRSGTCRPGLQICCFSFSFLSLILVLLVVFLLFFPFHIIYPQLLHVLLAPRIRSWGLYQPAQGGGDETWSCLAATLHRAMARPSPPESPTSPYLPKTASSDLSSTSELLSETVSLI